MTKVALLIGVSEYESGLDPLPSAMADVDALYRVLVDPARGDFLSVNIKVLKNPDRQEMEEAIYWLFNDRQKNDLLLFYFSGHGIKDDRNNNLYLSTRITRLDSASLVQPSAVAATYLQESLKFSKSERQVIILDACYSGAIAKGMTVKDDNTVRLDDYLGGKGRAILTSSTATEKSYGAESNEDGSSGLSIYTRYLVEGITTGAADLDEDDWISVDELHEYASKKVKQAAPAMTPKFYPVEEGFKIILSRSRRDDPKLKYEREVQKRAEEGNGKFSIFVEKILFGKQQEWKILPAEAIEIEDRVLQPYREYQKKLMEYETTLRTALINLNGLFSDREQSDLKEYQQQLKLLDEDVVEIHQQVYALSEKSVKLVNDSLVEVINRQVLHRQSISGQRLLPGRLFWLAIAATSSVIFALLNIIVGSSQKNDIMDNWAEPFIKPLIENNIMRGYSDGEFKPNQSITLAEFADVVNRAFELEPFEIGISSTDILTNASAEKVIQKVYQHGFTSGYPKDNFKSNQSASRIQILVSLINGIGMKPSANLDLSNVFYDADQVPSYGKNALISATQKCIATSVGYDSSKIPGGNFKPNAIATRADVAAYIYQTLVATGRITALSKSSPGNKYIASCPKGVYTTSISGKDSKNESRKPQ